MKRYKRLLEKQETIKILNRKTQEVKVISRGDTLLGYATTDTTEQLPVNEILKRQNFAFMFTYKKTDKNKIGYYRAIVDKENDRKILSIAMLNGKQFTGDFDRGRILIDSKSKVLYTTDEDIHYLTYNKYYIVDGSSADINAIIIDPVTAKVLDKKEVYLDAISTLFSNFKNYDSYSSIKLTTGSDAELAYRFFVANILDIGFFSTNVTQELIGKKDGYGKLELADEFYAKVLKKYITPQLLAYLKEDL